MYIMEICWEIIDCYIRRHVICNSISRGYHTNQWSWLIPFLYPSTHCWTTRSAYAGNFCRLVPIYFSL